MCFVFASVFFFSVSIFSLGLIYFLDSIGSVQILCTCNSLRVIIQDVGLYQTMQTDGGLTKKSDAEKHAIEMTTKTASTFQ